MSFYKYARNEFRKPGNKMKKVWRQRLKKWRKEDRIKRVENPTRISKARALGYKAKSGVIVVRGRIRRGGRKRRKISKGRRPKRNAQRKYTPKKNRMQIMEERVSRKYPNMVVLNSYPVAKDGNYKWFEHILVDPENPAVKNDKEYAKIIDERGRAHRGKTSAGRKARGLRNKGKGAEKVRPSVRSNKRQAN